MATLPVRQFVILAVITTGLLTGVLIALTGCSKLGGQDMQPGHAFLDSQIPAGLSPQYYPPAGFVWGGYRAGTLPEARYGVAAPPVNPKAQVLILADADYPAEVYFELMGQLMDKGYGVWVLEAPGQGGSGRYLLQNQSIFTRSYHDAQITAKGFITDIIKPTADKPLFVLGTGYSALTALSLSPLLKADSLKGFVAYAPYLGGPIGKGEAWHRDTSQPGYWGGIAQAWQMSNPDLRLRQKSDAWQTQMQKAFADLNGLHLPVLSLKDGAQVLVLQPQNGNTAAANSASALCARLPHCTVRPAGAPEVLGDDLTDFIQSQLPGISPPT